VICHPGRRSDPAEDPLAEKRGDSVKPGVVAVKHRYGLDVASEQREAVVHKGKVVQQEYFRRDLIEEICYSDNILSRKGDTGNIMAGYRFFQFLIKITTFDSQQMNRPSS